MQRKVCCSVPLETSALSYKGFLFAQPRHGCVGGSVVVVAQKQLIPIYFRGLTHNASLHGVRRHSPNHVLQLFNNWSGVDRLHFNLHHGSVLITLSLLDDALQQFPSCRNPALIVAVSPLPRALCPIVPVASLVEWGVLPTA
ncbi:hypothetical protein H310_14614 [Aphanomyces invadans]|uniref:Uncharacterized protein n=1 Tax=Aphanomyces invadans TaxID=157072 RepID=A0A024TBC6_9STRA|nr:hypothetical protein H310_14614 [Aphanomyces invadans]ETV90662.1 hypothetical protein H310_14614 [Aphanomyces invadans]|eukprot:XP_008880732.1 hypothetical protein H310_14614 [Aphanomyces invadans]